VVVSQDREDAPVPVRDVRTSGNTVAMISGREAFGLAWLQDWSGALFDGGAETGGSGDRFWFDRPEGDHARFAWDGSIRRIDDFRATPGGREAAYATDAELAAILEAEGIPSGPAPDHPAPLPSPRELGPPGLLVIIALLAGGLLAAVILRRRRRLADTARRT
jgi:hypothetical protein